MKRLKVLILSSVFMLGSFLSCDDTLDINTDPLAATSADPNAVLPYVIVQYSQRKTTEMGTRVSNVPQIISAAFNSPATGTTGAFLTGTMWEMMYTQALGNLVLVKADAEAAGETSNNVNAIATILMSHVFFELTSMWEDVPFSEALDGAVFSAPNVDKQEDVLNGILSMLDEAIVLIDSRPAEGNFAIIPASDMYYGGDMSSWKILANSLKLRTLMMLRSGGANVDSQLNQVLSQPLMESNDQSAFLRYAGGPGAQNAMQSFIITYFGEDNETVDLYAPGDPLIDLLDGTGDPRFDLWIARNNLPAPGNGIFPDPETSVLSNNVIRATLPDVLMTPAEIDLYKAQLALEGVSAAGDADSNYRNGVRNSLRWWGQDIPGIIETITDAEISAYVNSLGVPTITDVYNEQYLAAFLMPLQSWNHVRRNKVPALTPPPSTNITTILKRFTYPPDEIGTNPNIPANKMTDVPMWFENL